MVIEFLEITLIILVATISPGPDFMMVSRNSLRHTQKAGVMTALGISTGSLMHSFYCILGFAVILSHSVLVFNVIKYIGAAYLIYLGFKGLTEKKTHLVDEINDDSQAMSGFQAFRQGLFCTALNPKGILFFLAFYTVIIKPTMALKVQCFYAVEISLIDFLWYTVVAVLFSHPKFKAKLGSALHYLTKCFGGFLILFGLKIAV